MERPVNRNPSLFIRAVSRSTITKLLRLLLGPAALLCGHCVHAQDAVQEIHWSPDRFAFPALSAPTLIEVPAVESSGFHFAYFLYLPKGLPRTGSVRILVEPNNSGQANDDLEVQRVSARRQAATGQVRRLADRLESPLLMRIASAAEASQAGSLTKQSQSYVAKPAV
jgi:hypothetical protein